MTISCSCPNWSASARWARSAISSRRRLAQPNNEGIAGFVADTKFSIDRGFYDEAFEVEITSATPAAEIYYTRNGDPPQCVEWHALYRSDRHRRDDGVAGHRDQGWLSSFEH